MKRIYKIVENEGVEIHCQIQEGFFYELMIYNGLSKATQYWSAIGYNLTKFIKTLTRPYSLITSKNMKKIYEKNI